MPTLKNVLVRQAAIPMNFEKSIPVLPKVSPIMAQLAAAIPLGDIMLPEIPIVTEAVPMFPAAGDFAQIVKGFEDALPAGTPKLSEGIQSLTMGGYRPIEEKKEVAKPVHRIMGSGYRSI